MLIRTLVVVLLLASLSGCGEAVNSARDAARLSEARNNIKMLMIGVHNYHDNHKKFPGAIVDADGKPLLSWRVAILPYIQEQSLYQQVHLDEPWDSEHNRKLIDQMPKTFLNPGDTPSGKTHYQMVSGNGAILEIGQDRAFRDVTDGTARTIMLVEADQAVDWTKPEEWQFDPNQPNQGLGGVRKQGILVGMLDGSALLLQKEIPPQALKDLITYNGGEPTSPDEFAPRR